jgi:hypothetical protein
MASGFLLTNPDPPWKWGGRYVLHKDHLRRRGSEQPLQRTSELAGTSPEGNAECLHGPEDPSAKQADRIEEDGCSRFRADLPAAGLQPGPLEECLPRTGPRRILRLLPATWSDRRADTRHCQESGDEDGNETCACTHVCNLPPSAAPTARIRRSVCLIDWTG